MSGQDLLKCWILIYICRLAIRYELRKSRLHTIDRAQVIENKRGRLQKLIEMFEHQADSHLLHHKALDNVPITLLTDYSEFDNVDILDDSDSHTSPHLFPSISPPILHFSDDSSVDQTNAENLSILLPSSLGWGWCVQNHLQALAVTIGLLVRYDWICRRLVTRLYLDELILGAL